MSDKNFIPISKPSITQLEIDYVNDAVKSGWVSSLGKYVDEFEIKFANYCKTTNCVAVSNGTVALHLALMAIGIKQNDEVIVPDLTFVATANAVKYCGAAPVFVDVEPDTWCIDPQLIEKAITPKTKAIIVVHLYGQPANMDAIMNIAKKNNIYVIEDCAEAHGAKFKNSTVGSIGDVGIFSFYGNKIMTTGEGGALVTNSIEIAEKARFLKDHGMSKTRRYYHTEIGYNYRLTNIQAALGVAQLERIEELQLTKKSYLEFYKEHLLSIENLNLNPSIENTSSVCWLVNLDMRNFQLSKTVEIKESLASNNIDYRPFFIPMHQLPQFIKCKMVANDVNKPVSDNLSQMCISIPSGYDLKIDDMDRIVSTIKGIIL